MLLISCKFLRREEQLGDSTNSPGELSLMAIGFGALGVLLMGDPRTVVSERWYRRASCTQSGLSAGHTRPDANIAGRNSWQIAWVLAPFQRLCRRISSKVQLRPCSSHKPMNEWASATFCSVICGLMEGLLVHDFSHRATQTLNLDDIGLRSSIQHLQQRCHRFYKRLGALLSCKSILSSPTVRLS